MIQPAYQNSMNFDSCKKEDNYFNNQISSIFGQNTTELEYNAHHSTLFSDEEHLFLKYLPLISYNMNIPNGIEDNLLTNHKYDQLSNSDIQDIDLKVQYSTDISKFQSNEQYYEDNLNPLLIKSEDNIDFLKPVEHFQPEYKSINECNNIFLNKIYEESPCDYIVNDKLYLKQQQYLNSNLYIKSNHHFKNNYHNTRSQTQFSKQHQTQYTQRRVPNQPQKSKSKLNYKHINTNINVKSNEQRSDDLIYNLFNETLKKILPDSIQSKILEKSQYFCQILKQAREQANNPLERSQIIQKEFSNLIEKIKQDNTLNQNTQNISSTKNKSNNCNKYLEKRKNRTWQTKSVQKNTNKLKNKKPAKLKIKHTQNIQINA